MALLTRCTWVWGGSRCWWLIGKPGVLQSMGSQRFWHDWVTDLNCTEAWESGENGSWEVLQPTIKVCIYFTEWEEGCCPYEAPHFCVQNVGENEDQKLRTARERLWKAVSFVLQFTTMIAHVFVFGYGTCGILVPQEDMQPVPPEVEVFSLNHWTDREVPAHVFLSHLRFFGIIGELYIYSFQFSSVVQSCLTLCNPMNRSTPGLPVHHQLLEFTQTYVHPVSDDIQPSHPLSSPSPPAPNPF